MSDATIRRLSKLNMCVQWALLALICSLPLAILVKGDKEAAFDFIIFASVAAISGAISSLAFYKSLFENHAHPREAGIIGALIVITAFVIFGFLFTLIATQIYPANFSLRPDYFLYGWLIYSLSPVIAIGWYALPLGFWLGKKQYLKKISRS